MRCLAALFHPILRCGIFHVLLAVAESNIGGCSWLSSLFLSLQVNTGLKKLRIDGIDSDDTSAAIVEAGSDLNAGITSFRASNRWSDNDTCCGVEALLFTHQYSSQDSTDTFWTGYDAITCRHFIVHGSSGHVARE
jgi:hypothetical protein